MANPLTNAQQQLNVVGTNAGSSTATLPQLIGNLINVALTVIGIFLVVWFVYAGYQWMMSGGDEKKVADAKKKISSAVIGLVIILAAYAISSYVLSALTTATGG